MNDNHSPCGSRIIPLTWVILTFFSGASLRAQAALPLDYRGQPFHDAAYRVLQQAEADRPAVPYRAYEAARVLWDSSTATNGVGWVNGGDSGAFARLDERDAEGKRLIHFHAVTPNYRYAAFGWQWTPLTEKGVDLQDYAAVSFSLKVSGAKKPQELFFGVSAEEPAPVSLRPFQPAFADGGWHRVTIPLRALKWTPAATNREVRGISLKTFVWNASDFDLFVDNVGLERELPVGKGGAHSAVGEDWKAEAIRWTSTPAWGQSIPGKIECAFYDLGGEGVAYHDTTPINTLSAVLNQQPLHQRPHATPYHWNFRRDEGVDISFVKDFADLNHTNMADPPINQLYIGGTEDGEWCNYTVVVKQAGSYRIIAAYGNVAGAKPLRFDIDHQPAAECPCPVITTSMHKWTREEVGRITFAEPGTHLLTLHYERGYNLGYFEFELVKAGHK